MKIINDTAYTQIRVDSSLRQNLKVVSALKGFIRKELCESSLKHFLQLTSKPIIAPVRKGILYRVELSAKYKDALEQISKNQNVNISRILHSALFYYVEHFRKVTSPIEKYLRHKSDLPINMGAQMKASEHVSAISQKTI